MSAGVAHEIRNPLTAVKGFLQLLQEESPHRYVDVALSELDRAISIVQELLQVSKPDLDTEPYQQVSLCAELEASLNLFQNEAYRVKVNANFDDTDTRIFAKKNQLKKAFFNLLKNAFEAIPAEGTITLKHFRHGDMLRVVIKDSGVGIPPESLNLLGTPFFSTKDEGTGMGLAQVFSALYQQGATVSIDSQPSAGATFTIDFPLAEPDPIGGVDLALQYEDQQSFVAFFDANRAEFEVQVEAHATHTFHFIRESGMPREGVFDGLALIVHRLMEENRHELVILGKEGGRSAARNDYATSLLMELAGSFRKVMWDFLYQYHRHVKIDEEDVFQLERTINNAFDEYMSHYLTSYSNYKNEVLQSHREALDELSVPVIPLSKNKAILPLVGTIDTYRAKKVQENVLAKISELQLEDIIIDVSAVAFLDSAVVSYLFRIIDGIALMGCKAIITGIRPEIANTMITMGISLQGKVETRGTLQQALDNMSSF